MIFVPAVAMKSFAEERKRNTLEVLLSLPFSEWDIILGKFLAAFSIVLIGVALTLVLPVVLFFLSKVYLPEILVGYLGVVLLSSSFLSLSLYISSKTDSYIVSFLISAIAIFFLLVFSSDFASPVIPEKLLYFINFLLPLYHFDAFAKGVINLASVLYFVSFTIFFLFLTVIELEKKK